MRKISRRKMLKGIGGLAATGFALSGCKSTDGRRPRPGQDVYWKDFSARWWKQRHAIRERQRAAERERGERPDVDLPTPYLEFPLEASSRGYEMDQVKSLTLNQRGDVTSVIRNRGNGPSLTCVVEAYDGPLLTDGIVSSRVPYSDMTLMDRRIVIMQPGERKEVTLSYLLTRTTNGGVFLRMYDPFRDPGQPTPRQSGVRSASFGYWL